MKREQIKEVAVCMITENGLINLSRRDLCNRAGIPDGSFPHVMGCNFVEFVEELKEDGIEEGNHAVIKSRANPKLRKAHILRVAVEMSKKDGYHKITRDNIARQAGVSMGLITRYFNTMVQLRRCIIRYAIANEIVVIIAQGLADGDVHARKAPPELKAEAVSLLANF